MRTFLDSMRQAVPICRPALSFLIVALMISLPLITIAQDGAEAAAPQVRAKEFAFYGTNRADWAVLTTPDVDGQPFVWKIIKNPASPAPGAAQISIFNWGLFADTITPGSWTGDATYDPGIWRSNIGYWILPFEAPNTSQVIKWGNPTGDNLGREGDYDGDGIMDATVIRIVGGLLGWWIRLSSTGATRVVNFGTTAANTSLFAFRGADFTGDGRDELILCRVINATGLATWFVGDAVTGAQLMQVNWGNFNTHFIINPADYTGDGRADLITWSAGEANVANQVWHIYNPVTNQRANPIGLRFGVGDPNFVNNDLPIRGDYDGDGTHDICVWRPSNATFYCRASVDGSLIVQQWGVTDDTPLANFFTF
jgi:hypothetical protein